MASTRCLVKFVLIEFLSHHNLIVITQAGDGNLLHFIVELNREHALVFLLVHVTPCLSPCDAVLF